MPQKFSPRQYTYPPIHFVDEENPASTFFARAQNLNRQEEPISKFSFTQAFGRKLCRFCQACFKNLPINGETKRIQYRSGFRGLCRSAKHCLLCAFYFKLILSRCNDTIFQNEHMFSVYIRNANSQPATACPIINIGFQIKSHCMFAMAFCPDLSKYT